MAENENAAPEPETSSDVTAADAPTGGYRESEDHVPDLTAMTGTLETTGTGGGHHERITGATQIFSSVEEITRKVESLVAARIDDIRQELRSLLIQHEASQAQNIQQQTVEQAGLPSSQGSIVSPADDTGVASDAERSANVSPAGPQESAPSDLVGKPNPEARAAYDKAWEPPAPAAPTTSASGDAKAAPAKKAAAKKTTTPPKK